MKTQNDVCDVCGNDIAVQSKYKKKKYCNDACRDYMKFKDALERTLFKINPNGAARKVIRGDMFRLCNLVGNGTKAS